LARRSHFGARPATYGNDRNSAQQGGGGGGPPPDYYIGLSGSDSNPGTLASPWALTAINTKQATYAGKTVGLLDGTYGLVTILGQPPGNGSNDYGQNRLQVKGGSSGSPTVIKSVNPRGAIIDWQKSIETSGSASASMGPTSDYVTIQDLVFTNATYRCINNYASEGTGGNHLTVTGCQFENQVYSGGGSANAAAIYTQGWNDILITNCRFQGGSAPNDDNRYSCIKTYTATHRCTIEYCTFIAEAGTGNCIYFKDGSNFTPIVRYCHMDRSAGSTSSGDEDHCVFFDGQTTDNTDTASFHHNVMIQGGSNNAVFAADNFSGFIGTYDFHNNTFVGPWGSGGAIRKAGDGNPVATNIYNNIFYRVSGSPSGTADVNIRSIATVGTMDYNYYPSTSPTWVMDGGSPTYSSLSAWLAACASASRADIDAHSITGANPLFVGSGTDAAAYQLQAGSPCKTLGAGGTEIGAWAGQSQIGSSF